MKVPLYILGFLLKYGPLHGYRLKQIISKEVSDFTDIKQPTIYYHLERMEKEGLVTSKSEQEGNRPERMVYKITKAGRKAFIDYLTSALDKPFDPEYLIDGPIFFIESIEKESLMNSLSNQIKLIDGKISDLLLQSSEIMMGLEGKEGIIAKTLFNHRIYHYQVELKWLRETYNDLQQFVTPVVKEAVKE
jgi:DNA-binding PadR family transcriptional regulator